MIMLLVYAGLIGLAGWQFSRAPSGFIPTLDQGYLIVVVQLPPAIITERAFTRYVFPPRV